MVVILLIVYLVSKRNSKNIKKKMNKKLKEKGRVEHNKSSLLQAIRKKQRKLESDWAIVDVYGIQLKHLYQGKVISLDEAWRIHNENRRISLAQSHLLMCSSEDLLKELKVRINDGSIGKKEMEEVNTGNDYVLNWIEKYLEN